MSSSRQSTEVAIVGGGFSGLAAAVAASRAGLRVTVLERSAALSGRAGRLATNALLAGRRLPLQPVLDVQEPPGLCAALRRSAPSLGLKRILQRTAGQSLTRKA